MESQKESETHHSHLGHVPEDQKEAGAILAEESKLLHSEDPEDVVTAFNIEAASEKGIDYEKLIKKFGCYAITPEMVEKLERLTGKRPHRLLRRGVFFCHR